LRLTIQSLYYTNESFRAAGCAFAPGKAGGTMKSKQQVVSEFRRAEILDAARTIFARRGFASATMDEVAREAGIAKGTTYLYFKSKVEVYRAVLDHDMKALSRSTLERMGAAASLKDKIYGFMLARLENADNRREFFKIMDAENGNLALTRRQYRDWLREPVLRLAAAIEEAAARGEIRALPAEKAAWAVVDMTRGTVQRRLLAQTHVPAEQDAQFLLEFVWPALTAPPTGKLITGSR